MSLTTGRGPLGKNPAGRFSSPMPSDIVYVEPFDRRVHAVRGDDTVVDSEQVLLVHRAGQPPSFAFPAGDVTGVATDAEPDAPGYVRVAWDAVDAWYEEDEQVHGHPRNPYHRVDCIATSRWLRVEVAGEVLVDTHDTLGVYETALVPKLYVDRDAVRTDLLVASATRKYCPYKGTSFYWSAVIGEQVVEDICWTYEDPYPECGAIRGLFSFEPDRVTMQHDLPAR